MRIQVNKLGLTPVDYSLGIEYLGASRGSHDSTWLQFRDFDAYVVHYCNHCGAEIYGKWIYNTVYFEPETYDSKRENARQNDPKQYKYIEEQYALMAQAEKKFYSDRDALQVEVDEIIDLKVCPCCSGVLSHNEGYLAAIDGVENIIDHELSNKYRTIYGIRRNMTLSLDAICEAMQKLRLDQQCTDANKCVDVLLAQHEDSAPTEIISGYAKIKDQSEDLKGYILKVIQTETNILSLTKRLQVLYAQRFDADRSAYGSSLLPLTAAKEEIKEAENNLRKCKNTLTLLASKTLTPVDLPMPKRPQKPTEPQYEQPGLFNKKRILAQNAELKAQYEQACYRYECAMDRYNQALESRKQQIAQLTKQQEEQHRHNIEEAQRKIEEAEEKLAAAQKKEKDISATSADIATPEKARKVLLDSEIQQAEGLLQKAIHCKHQLYNYNIIFEKYRNLVALSTIYEYLMAGRCISLEGANGAYNLYESELRANIIISQLNNVLESLEAIKEKQYMIYSEIQKVNSSLRRLESTMETAVESLSTIEVNTQTMTQYMEVVTKNSNVIAHNTATTAYYSKISAELTDALGYMVAFK